MQKFLVIAVLIAASSAAYGQHYGELSWGALTFTSKGTNTFESQPKQLRALTGYTFTDNFALEGIVGFGLGEETIKTNGTSNPSNTTKLNNISGLYMAPKVQIFNGLDAGLRIGIARSNTQFKLNRSTETQINTSASYGVSIRYLINRQTSVNADYMNYGATELNGITYKIKGYTVGAGYKF